MGVDESPADRRRRINDKVRPAASPGSSDLPMYDGLERFAGTWFDREGTRIGEIQGHVMTWAFNDCPPSEVCVNASGELLAEVDGEFHLATFKNDGLHFSDGDFWTKAEPAKQ